MSEKKKLINETTNNKIKNNYINQINNSITNTNIKEKNISIKLKSNTKRKDEYLKTFLFLFTSFLFLVKIGIIQYILSITYPPMKEKLIPIIDFHTPKEKSQSENKNNIEFNIIPEYEVPDDENELCKVIEPFEIMRDRFKVSPIDFCRSSKSNHVCYINNLNYFIVQRGVICKMQNVVIDPSKWKDDGYTYNGPSNNITRGCPILEYGFFNMKCDNLQNKTKYNYIYENYFDSWNYNYKYNEKYEELARGKIIFFISRNQDSPNLYFGFSGIINALSMIYYFKLDPENIQVVFLESMRIDNDPYYDFYKYLISRGGEPIHVRDLKKKYLISEAVHVPINWDSPCFILYGSLSSCKYQVKGFHYLNEFINKYMNIPEFIEPINYNKEIFYYPKMIVEPNSKIYTKYITFQWRKAWPKGRKGQRRLLGNGPDIVEKLSEKLPKNYLIRLVDTSSLTIIEQISIIKKTDYFIGVHGAGLMLSIYLPKNSIVHEISLPKKTNNLIYMSNLSGHKTFSDIFKANVTIIDNCQYVYFDPILVVNSVLKHMNETNFF